MPIRPEPSPITTIATYDENTLLQVHDQSMSSSDEDRSNQCCNAARHPPPIPPREISEYLYMPGTNSESVYVPMNNVQYDNVSLQLAGERQGLLMSSS